MCVPVVKPNKDGNPHHVKSHIVYLGNFEDHIYQCSHQYDPVLKYDYLCLLTAKAVGDKCILQQGDYKNTFYNAVLPDDKTTSFGPPLGIQYFTTMNTSFSIKLFTVFDALHIISTIW